MGEVDVEQASGIAALTGNTLTLEQMDGSVTYMLGDNEGKVRMDKEPGSRIPLDENGQLVLD